MRKLLAIALLFAPLAVPQTPDLKSIHKIFIEKCRTILINTYVPNFSSR